MNNAYIYLSEIYYLLGQDKKRIPFLILIFFISSFCDVVSLTLLIPYISLVFSDANNEYLIYIPEYFENLFVNDDNIIHALGLFIIITFIVKLFISIYSIYIINSFSFQRTRQLKKDLVIKFFNLSYQDVLNKNSSEYVNSTNVLSNIYAGAISIILKTFSDGLVVLGIIITILFISPLVLISLILLLGIIAIIYYYFFHRKISVYGQRAVIANQDFIKSIIENFRGFKQVKIFDLKDFFMKRSDIQANIYAKYSTLNSIFTGIPRPLFELIIVIILLFSISLMTSYGQNIQSFFPIFSAFVYLGVRILPFLSSFIQAVLHLKFHRKAISLLFNDLFDREKRPVSSQKTYNFTFREIEANKIQFSYDNSPNKTMEIDELKINAGETVAIAGMSGSGKSTVANILLGFLKPNKGIIKCNGVDLENVKEAFRSQIGYLPQEPFFIDDTIQNNICLGERKEDINFEKLNKAVKLADIDNFISSLPNGLNSSVGENGTKLSGGQAQRLSLARLFYFDRPIILLDEVTSALDFKTESYIYDSINEIKGKKTIIIISHKSKLISLCDKIFNFENNILSEAL